MANGGERLPGACTYLCNAHALAVVPLVAAIALDHVVLVRGPADAVHRLRGSLIVSRALPLLWLAHLAGHQLGSALGGLLFLGCRGSVSFEVLDSCSSRLLLIVLHF